jgi:aminoglycoside phosphotransferase (APT) family kinase protein
LAEASVEAVGAAVARLVPELAGAPVVLVPRVPGNPPRYWQGTAQIGDRHIAKFAWSAEAAVTVGRELAVLELLREVAPSLPIPEVVAGSRDPVLFVTRRVPGIPAGNPYADDPSPSRIPTQLAEVLAVLHDPAVRDHLAVHLPDLDAPEPQATTDALRERFAGPVVQAARAGRVRMWCDWIDDVQQRPAPEPTVVHGDLHAHNLVVSEDGRQLRLVVDFGEAALGDPAYDFRYLVAMRHDLDWFTACHSAYERRTRRRLPLERILAWHIRTALGDALWRTERSHLPLPGNLSPDDYVDDIARRVAHLGRRSSFA